jgi:hypothetical protein
LCCRLTAVDAHDNKQLSEWSVCISASSILQRSQRALRLALDRRVRLLETLND